MSRSKVAEAIALVVLFLFVVAELWALVHLFGPR